MAKTSTIKTIMWRKFHNELDCSTSDSGGVY